MAESRRRICMGSISLKNAIHTKWSINDGMRLDAAYLRSLTHGESPKDPFAPSGPDWRLYGSTQRPNALIDWVRAQTVRGVHDDVVGPHFWTMVMSEWSGFELVPHDTFAALFARFQPYWVAQPELKELPQALQVYRGGNRNRAHRGLSFTTDRSVAESFAVGHRGIQNMNPTVVSAVVERSEVCFVCNDRNESEVVLRTPPAQLSVVWRR